MKIRSNLLSNLLVKGTVFLMMKWTCVIGWFCVWGVISQLLPLPTNAIFNIAQALVLAAGGYAIIFYFDKREKVSRAARSNK